MAARWAEALLKLQTVDLRIRELETRLALLPKEMGELKAKRDAAVAEVAAAAFKTKGEETAAFFSLLLEVLLTDNFRAARLCEIYVRKIPQREIPTNLLAASSNPHSFRKVRCCLP